MNKMLKGLWRDLWYIVWNISEFTHIPLGRAAPWVFGQMIGCKSKRKKLMSLNR